MRTISKGIRNARGESFASPNFAMRHDLIRIAEHEGALAHLAPVAYIAYIFSPRVPSETIRLQIAGIKDRLAEFTPQIPMALIGVRNCSHGAALIVKFIFRNNIRRGCVLTGPCLCRETDRSARRLCPAHSLWARAKTYARPGGLLFPKLSANSANQQVKTVMAASGYTMGGKFSPHSFREVATQEILACGSTLSAILRPATWTPGGYKCYLDLQAGESLIISTILLETALADSDDPDPDKHNHRDTLRKRIPIPLTLAPRKPKTTPTRAKEPTPALVQGRPARPGNGKALHRPKMRAFCPITPPRHHPRDMTPSSNPVIAGTLGSMRWAFVATFVKDTKSAECHRLTKYNMR